MKRLLAGINKRPNEESFHGPQNPCDHHRQRFRIEKKSYGRRGGRRGASRRHSEPQRTGIFCVPAKAYEAMLERLEDLELNAIADAREGQPIHRVTLDELCST